MTVLLIKLKNGRIVEGKESMHFLLMEKYNIDFNDILDVGFKTKVCGLAGVRVVWQNRKPDILEG